MAVGTSVAATAKTEPGAALHAEDAVARGEFSRPDRALRGRLPPSSLNGAPRLRPADVVALQHTIGNAAVARLLAAEAPGSFPAVGLAVQRVTEIPRPQWLSEVRAAELVHNSMGDLFTGPGGENTAIEAPGSPMSFRSRAERSRCRVTEVGTRHLDNMGLPSRLFRKAWDEGRRRPRFSSKTI